MNVCILITYGDLSMSVDLQDATTQDAAALLNTTCNELLRLNMALTMQAEQS